MKKQLKKSSLYKNKNIKRDIQIFRFVPHISVTFPVSSQFHRLTMSRRGHRAVAVGIAAAAHQG